MSEPVRSRAGRPRVVVSGLGIVSPFGAGTKTFWTGLSAGTCAIRPATLLETDGFRSRLTAEVPQDVMTAFAASHRRSRADRLAVTAASEALADAYLEIAENSDNQTQVVLLQGLAETAIARLAWLRSLTMT